MPTTHQDAANKSTTSKVYQSGQNNNLGYHS